MSLDIVYVGESSFAELPPMAPQIDDYGLDTLTRRYSGKNLALDYFLSTWLDGGGEPLLRADYQYSGMYAVGRPDVSRGRAYSEVSVKFVGKISNAEPLVKITDNFREDTAQVQGGTGTEPNHVFGVIADYRANTTTYEYCSRTRPAAPRYTDGASGNEVAISSIGTGSDGIINTATPHGLVVGQAILFEGITGGTPALNGANVVKAVTDTDTFTIETSVSVAGTGGTVGPASRGIEIIRARGQINIATTLYGANNVAIIPVQQLSSFERQQNGNWWECKESWEWALTPGVLYDDPSSDPDFVIVQIAPVIP